MRAALSAAVLAVCLLWAWSAQAATYTARVVDHGRGDTLHALHDGRELIVRLRWIDAPEKGQPFGDQAKQALGELVTGQAVTIRDYGPDRHGSAGSSSDSTLGMTRLTNASDDSMATGSGTAGRRFGPKYGWPT
jgi:hypothetical protein